MSACRGSRIRNVPLPHKNGEEKFHLQWTEPLKEQRIVLIYYEVIEYEWRENRHIHIEGLREAGWFPTDSDWATIRAESNPYTSFWFGRRIEGDYFLIFPAGSFRSKLLTGPPWSVLGYNQYWDLISVEILSADARLKVELPRTAFYAEDEREREEDILAEHPFQPYNVGEPSKLILNDFETLKNDHETRNSENEEEGPPRATTVMVDPAPGVTVPSDQSFILALDQGVAAVTVNGEAANGSGRDWIVSPGLQPGPDRFLTVQWINRDNSAGSQTVGPYNVKDPD